MNLENLHELISRYENDLDNTMNPIHQEQFKWEAVQSFGNVWFSDDASKMPFSELLALALKNSYVLIDNSRVSPSNGIIKMAEAEPEYVRHLFEDILFADDHGDLLQRQRNMDDFMDKAEILRQKLFPRHWKYKNDRHAVSCYLAFYQPEQNYIYRYSEADMMAKYIGFEKTLGMGQKFSLPAYYEMCDIIASALREHPSLLYAHQSQLEDKHYRDDSLHIMAFDLMYCCRAYEYYKGLVPFEFSKKNGRANELHLQVLNEQKKQQLLKSIDEANDHLLSLQTQLADLELISLIGTEVSTAKYGKGFVYNQEENKISVRFENAEIAYNIHKKYPMRPQFEDEDLVVELLSHRADTIEQINLIQKQKDRDIAAIDKLS